jgi:hypothetical protein
MAILSPLKAQSDLEIRKAFEQYGEKKGVVMVEEQHCTYIFF